MRRVKPIADAGCALLILFIAAGLVAPGDSVKHLQNVSGPLGAESNAYLGFDANDYPGDAALLALRRSFSFAGYWLNRPPGGSSVPWTGKRDTLRNNGFGFLVLFNGRLEHELRTTARATTLGSSDARTAAQAAKREGFPARTVIFLDQEEGGELEPDQTAYVLAWVDGVTAADFRSGVYCSGMAAEAGHGRLVKTAEDLREQAGQRQIVFFVYNDACPPSPGCAPRTPPPPGASGVPFASVWQFAQSPRRRSFTAHCSSTYDRDGNCYQPGERRADSIFLDLDSATSADPSGGR